MTLSFKGLVIILNFYVEWKEKRKENLLSFKNAPWHEKRSTLFRS